MTWLSVDLVPLLIRICLVILFPFSALDKIFDWQGALKQAKSSFLPNASAPWLLVAAIIVELAAPFCIVLRWHDQLAAFVLAGFCVVSALLYHNFWNYPDFWIRGESKARSHFWDFLKNFGLVGGLLLIACGATLAPADKVASQPLSSAPVYSRSASAAPPAPSQAFDPSNEKVSVNEQ
ncbi:DoxX family protein [Nitrosococcus watsonii]|uniref:DoxX family protein n=1 Tax=Nitrosococcus watsoni (strain C-113) TaxID=105559 RepID=D8KAI6_NITWC|nr:DoxX family protein [Nitrosococcus watsonii]ADJ29413.1 DoxX family protein [Nitrosococcus watsonii C-113]